MRCLTIPFAAKCEIEFQLLLLRSLVLCVVHTILQLVLRWEGESTVAVALKIHVACIELKKICKGDWQ